MKVNKILEAEFFYGATPKIFRRAEELRKNMTRAELILWNHLRLKQMKGLTFRRQHPVNNFIADFYCHKKRLVVEVDGKIHNIEEIKERDEGREYMMKELGLSVLRFTNNEVLNDIKNVLMKIEQHLSIENQ
jgi:very-short-patch-repair endonuclease